MNRHHRFLAGLGPLGLMFGCSAPAPAAHRGSTTTSASPRADAGSDATAATREAATSTGPDTSLAGTETIPSVPAGPTTTVTVTVPATVARSNTTTVFVLPEREDEGLSDAEWWEAQPGYVAGACGGSLPPCSVMRRESGGDLRVWNGGCYYPVDYAGPNPCGSTASGKWQFLRSTWAWFGGYRNAADAPESVQDDAARELWRGGRGCSHWSAC